MILFGGHMINPMNVGTAASIRELCSRIRRWDFGSDDGRYPPWVTNLAGFLAEESRTGPAALTVSGGGTAEEQTLAAIRRWQGGHDGKALPWEAGLARALTV